MKIYDREKASYYEEKEYGKKKLEILYNTFIGRVLLKYIFASRWLSKLVSLYQKSRLSKKDISKFISKNNIDMKEYKEASEYNSFSDFFKRKRIIKKSPNIDENDFIAIADSKLQVFNISKELVLDVKYSKYNICDIVQNTELSKDYEEGICLVFRLAVDDYHRYVYLDDGKLKSSKYIKGTLHTIRPISKEYNVYSRNSRVVSVLNTKNFGQVVQIEVGAMLIGKINNSSNLEFKKLDEKGFFDYGGSTIILLLKKDVIKIDEDIMKNSIDGIETKVKIGMKIGEKRGL